MRERHGKIQQQAQENQRKNEAEMAAFLGQQKLQAWKEYQSSMGMRYELENMRNTLSAKGLPLNDEHEQAHAQGAGTGESRPKRMITTPPSSAARVRR